MYCPQCGQLQTSELVRFCSRCGFLLEAVSAVLAGRGMAPRYVQPGPKVLSPRSKGVRQGALMMLSTLFVVPVLAIIIVPNETSRHRPGPAGPQSCGDAQPFL